MDAFREQSLIHFGVRGAAAPTEMTSLRVSPTPIEDRVDEELTSPTTSAAANSASADSFARTHYPREAAALRGLQTESFWKARTQPRASK